MQEIFGAKLAEARAKVEEPPQPKLKLNMSGAAPSPAPKQQLKLKLRQSPVSDPNTPAGRSSATPGVLVDSDALLRQQRHVLDSIGDRRSSRPLSTGKAATPTAGSPFTAPKGAPNGAPPSAPMRTLDSPAVANGIKQDVQSPALSATRPTSTGPDSLQRLSVPAQTPHPVMAPPQAMSRPASGSPHPNGVVGQPGPFTPQYQAPTYYVPTNIPRFDSFRKTPLKSK
jgi:hypothetical protein